MQKNKIGKLPLVENGKLVGLYSFSDVRTLIENVEPHVQPRRPVPPARRRGHCPGRPRARRDPGEQAD